MHEATIQKKKDKILLGRHNKKSNILMLPLHMHKKQQKQQHIRIKGTLKGQENDKFIILIIIKHKQQNKKKKEKKEKGPSPIPPQKTFDE